jgi:LAO/AO transport system kinase
MEIADIFVVNKADREGADRLMADLQMVGKMQWAAARWEVPILATEAHRGVGIEELYAAIEAHRRYLEQSGELQRRRAQHRGKELWDLIENRLRQRLRQRVHEDRALAAVVEEVIQGKIDPHSAAARILDDKEMLQRWLLSGDSGAEQG